MIRQQHNKTALASQRMIADALMMLLNRKPFQSITVTELCREAAIGRKTFYRNFDEKEDVIDLILEDLLREYRTSIQNAAPDKWLGCYFAFIRAHAAFFTALHQNGLIDRANRHFSVLIAETMPKWSDDPVEQAYRSSFVCAGINAIVAEWLRRGCRDSISRLIAFSPIDR